MKFCTDPTCNRKLDTDTGGDDFVVLRPCKCVVCPRCAFQLVVNRKLHNPACKIHKKQCVEQVFYIEGCRKEQCSVDVIDIKQHEITRERDPCRYYQSMFGVLNEHDAKHKLILSLSYAQQNAKNNSTPVPSSVTVELDRDYGPETEKDEINLRKVFGLLHEPIIRSHGEVWKKTKYPRMTPSEFCSYMMHDDESLLLKLVYALATGEMTVPMAKIATDRKFFSRFLACCVAKEMLQRLEIEKPGPFQLMMGDTLNLIDAPAETKEFMSKLRVAAHRTTMERECTRQALHSARQKISLDPLSAFSIHFDNIGFKGRTKKWSQHTVVQICKIPYEKLKEAGFYQGDKLSRQRKSFEDIVEEVRLETGEENEENLTNLVSRRIVGITQTDWDKLATRVINTISTAIALDLPNEQQCREFAEVDSFCSFRFPLHLGNPIKTPPRLEKEVPSPVANIAINEGIPDASLDEPRESIRSARKTFYETNDMTLDNVLHEDPNKTQTVAMLAEYLEEASQYPDNFDLKKSGGELPVRDMYAPATCDGAPMKRWLDLRAEDIEKNGFESRAYKRALLFNGGFHFHMEFISMRGRLSRGVFSFFGRLWRPSLPQLNWILSISDPKEYLQEIPQYLLAHYRSAYDMLVDHTSDGRNPSAADVQAHMLKRAVEIPYCMAVLLDLRLIEISLMIRDSEKSGKHGDVELFLTTMRFALALFTVTHATNYAHIVCDFLEWWELASEADKVFFKTWLFTKISPNGKPIFVDRGVEWTVRHVRMFLGKRSRPNQNQRMETVVPDIPFRIKAKTELHNLLGPEEGSSWTSGDWNLQTGRLSKAYFETVKAIYDTNLWGKGRLEGALACDSPDYFIHPEEGEELPMSNSFLSAFDLGEERAKAYYAEHHIVNRGTVSRSEEYVSLKLLPTVASTRTIELQKLKDIRLSVDAKVLEPLTKDFPKEKVLKELMELRECIYPEIPEYRSKVSRADLIADLCKFRLKYFQDYPQVYADTLESVDAVELENTFTSADTRRKQVLSPIYSFQQNDNDV